MILARVVIALDWKRETWGSGVKLAINETTINLTTGKAKKAFLLRFALSHYWTTPEWQKGT